MYFCEDISDRMIFDNVSESYVAGRPGYPREMHLEISDKIFGVESASRAKSILEVGAGSGQATSGLEEWTKHLVCVEPGENFISLLRKKFKNYQNVELVKSTYESFVSKDKFDLIFSGCALHWVPKDIAISRSVGLLRSGGWSAPGICLDFLLKYIISLMS